MISLQTIFKDPRSIVDFYKLAVNKPRGFANNLKLDEDLTYSVYVGLVLFVATSLSNILNIGILQILIGGIVSTSVVFIAGIFTLLIAHLAKAEMDYKESITFSAYIFLLCLPFIVLSNFLTVFSIGSTAVYFLFTYLVIVESRNGDKNTVTWICGVIMALSVISFLI